MLGSLNELLTTEEVCSKLKIKRTTFDNMKKDTEFPTPYRVTGLKGYRYSESEILIWLQSRKVKTKKVTPNIKPSMQKRNSLLTNAKTDAEKKIILMLNRGSFHGAA